MRAINLLPPNAYAAKQRLPHAPVVLASTVPLLVAAVVYLGYSVEHSSVVDRQTTLSFVQSQIAALGPSPELVSESAGVASDRSARETELTDALAKQVPWDVILDQISRVLPGDAWLTTLTVQSPTPAGGASSSATPTAFSVQGYTSSQAAVAQVLTRLALVPSLSSVALGSTTTVGTAAKPLVQFTVTASVKGSS